MVPLQVFPKEAVTGSGFGPAVALGEAIAKPLQLQLTITRMMERQTLDIFVWGSIDGNVWGVRPILTLPHRYYCGSYCHLLNLSEFPSIRYMRVEYKIQDWGHSSSHTVSAFELTAEAAHELVLAAH